ncbi:uncharacterized protein [Clytia hemisphaerica]
MYRGIFLLVLCILSTYGNSSIKRVPIPNSLDFTETVIYDSSSNQSNITCPQNQIALLDGQKQLQCTDPKTISNCIFPLSTVPVNCKLSSINVRNTDQIWVPFNKGCFTLNNKTNTIKSSCDNLGGWIFKADFLCSDEKNDTTCFVFSFPGFVEKDLLDQTPVQTTASTTFVNATTAATTNSTLSTTFSTSNQTDSTNSSTNATVVTPSPLLTTMEPIIENSTKSIKANATAIKPLITSTTKHPMTTKITSTAKNGTVIIVTIATTIDSITTISLGNEEDDKNKGLLLYILIPTCIAVLIVLGCCLFVIFCRKRCWKRNRDSLPLLKINPGSPVDEDNIEELYATPTKKNKSKKTKQKKTSDQETPPKPIWPDYDEVGVTIEGAYEKRESANIEDIPNYGVSAKLLQADDAIKSPTKDENPYEALGRCNSFNPKSRAEREKNKEQIELKEKPTKNDPDSREMKPDMGDEVELPYVGKGKAPMQMSSFKPGSSMRKKQQRTSIRKPKRDDDTSSETHEEVTITPLPLKKNFNESLKTPELESGNLSTHSSYERLPDELDRTDSSKVDDSTKQPVENVDVAGTNELEQNESNTEEPETENVVDKTPENVNGPTEPDENSTNSTPPPKPPKSNYADIEFMKATETDKDPIIIQNGNHAPSGNYTDVIIDP